MKYKILLLSLVVPILLSAQTRRLWVDSLFVRGSAGDYRKVSLAETFGDTSLTGLDSAGVYNWIKNDFPDSLDAALGSNRVPVNIVNMRDSLRAVYDSIVTSTRALRGINSSAGTYQIIDDLSEAPNALSYGELLYSDVSGTDTLIHVWDSDDANVMCEYSYDQGYTWTAESILYTDPSPGAGNKVEMGTMIIADNGDWILIYMIREISTGDDQEIRYCSSSDRGSTWGSATTINQLATGSVTTQVTSACKLSNGNLVVAWSEVDSDDWYPNYLRAAVSTDNGATFGTPNTFYTNDSLGQYINGTYQEPAIACDSNDSLVVICRCQSAPVTSVFYTGDAEETWTFAGLIGQTLSSANGGRQANPELLSIENDRFMAIIGHRANLTYKSGWVHILTSSFSDLKNSDNPYFAWTTYTPPFYTDQDPGSKNAIINTDGDIVMIGQNQDYRRYVINKEMLANNHSYIYNGNYYNNDPDCYNIWLTGQYVINNLNIQDTSYQVIGRFCVPNHTSQDYHPNPVGTIPVLQIHYRGSNVGADSMHIIITNRTGYQLYGMALEFKSKSYTETKWLPMIPYAPDSPTYEFTYYQNYPLNVEAKIDNVATATYGCTVWDITINFGYVFK